MPKRVTYMQAVPPVKPDRCSGCPFLGIVPRERRKKGSKKTMLCLATMKALSHESISISEAERKGTRHPFHRPCDMKWDAWHRLPGMKMGISIAAYNECRIPYEQQLQYEIDFN